jgi:hypothetical protein
METQAHYAHSRRVIKRIIRGENAMMQALSPAEITKLNTPVLPNSEVTERVLFHPDRPFSL